MLLIITIIINLQGVIFAKTPINQATILDKGECEWHLQYNKNGQWLYVTTTYTVYEKNGVEYPAYCINRESNNIKRAIFTPEEICEITINFYKRNYIEGLFLSSGIIKNPDYTMELMNHHSNYIEETIKTIDNLIYGIKSRIDIEQLLTAGMLK